MPKLVTKRRESRYQAYLSAVESLEGPAPINVFRTLREDPPNAHRFPSTLQGCADSIGISKQALIRTEQGVYTEPPERVMKWFLNHCDLTYPELLNAYKLYQTAMRRRHHYIFGREPKFPVGQHPLNVLLSNWTDPSTGLVFDGAMNPTECAKLLCLSQSVLDHWLNKIKHQQSVPQQFTNALKDAGYDSKVLKTLDDAYELFRTGSLPKRPEGLQDTTQGVSFKDALIEELKLTDPAV